VSATTRFCCDNCAGKASRNKHCLRPVFTTYPSVWGVSKVARHRASVLCTAAVLHPAAHPHDSLPTPR
jgi:hypothetical protein